MILYDYKEMGLVVVLFQSGLMQIRGWNVNVYKKRGGSKVDKVSGVVEVFLFQEREEFRQKKD